MNRPVPTAGFFDPRLLTLEYFERQRFAYEHYFEEGLISKYRCYPVVLGALQTIFSYRPEHARSFAKRFRSSAKVLRNSDAIVSEVLVYAHYVPLIGRGLVRQIDLCKDDFDLKICRADMSDACLEVFCVMPEFSKDDHGSMDYRKVD